MFKLPNAVIILLSFIQVFSVCGCRTHAGSEQVAGKNARAEALLSEVTSYYHARNDSLGVESARFLIGNLSGHGTYDAGLEKQIADEEQITGKYLIETINSSLTQCRDLIASGQLRKSDFFEYILPHRIGKERLYEWKSACIAAYRRLDDSLGKGASAHKAALDRIVTINAPLIGHFAYSNDMPNARNLNWQQLMAQKSGNCIAMAHAITYPLRALGIPVAHDFASAWGNLNGNGHQWNAYISKSDGPIPFLGFERSPPEYSPFLIYEKLGRLPAKVFRETYSVNPRALPFISTNKENLPGSLSFERAIDVTREYVQTDDLNIRLGSQVAGSVGDKMLYLSCFNAGVWKPVFWSDHKDGSYHFRDMTTRMLYLPTVFDRRNGAIPVEYPFVAENGTVHRFRPDMDNRQDIRITYTQPKEMDAIALFGPSLSQEEFYRQIALVMKDKKRSFPEPGNQYKLYYWRGDWKLAGAETATRGGELTFRNVPKNAIYRLISDKNLEQSARVFSYNGSQQWW